MQEIKINMNASGDGGHYLKAEVDNEWIKCKCPLCGYEVWFSREDYKPKYPGEVSPIPHGAVGVKIPYN